MASLFLRGRDLVGLYLFIDTNALIGALYRDDAAAKELFRLWDEGWIGLGRTDTMNTECFEGQDASTQAQREEEAADFPEAYGPFVLDHSRLGSAAFASSEDEARIKDAFAIFFPETSWSVAKKNAMRDAMHVATAARYGGHAFVTNDEALFKKDQLIAQRLAIRVWSPQQALAEARSRVRALRVLHEREPQRGPLPDWPM
jgi:predicted nucleic acid-binding protein